MHRKPIALTATRNIWDCDHHRNNPFDSWSSKWNYFCLSVLFWMMFMDPKSCSDPLSINKILEELSWPVKSLRDTICMLKTTDYHAKATLPPASTLCATRIEVTGGGTRYFAILASLYSGDTKWKYYGHPVPCKVSEMEQRYGAVTEES
jgi:hypothetical protein